jgi:uncharacterized protein (DUF2062 family)
MANAGIINWVRQRIPAMPTREHIAHYRFIGFLARRPELWRFTRRSVPRGVAVGLLIGIFALIPGVQLIGAALMCLPCRGNIPLATLMTFISIPPTTIGIFLPGALVVGNGFGFHADVSTISRMMEQHAGLGEWVTWLLSDAAPSLVLGLFVIATVVAVAGFFLSTLAWRILVARKWTRRPARRKVLHPAG